MATRHLLDAETVAALEAGEKELIVWDGDVPGFGVRVFPSGTKSWIVVRKMVGDDGKARRRRVSIGRYGEMSLEDARVEAMKLLGEGGAGPEEAPAATGLNPKERSKALSGESTASAGVQLYEGEVMDPETGEILQAGAEGEGNDLEDEDLGLDDLDLGQRVTRTPVGAADTEEHEAAVGLVLDKTLDGVVAEAKGAPDEGLENEASVSGPGPVEAAGASGEGLAVGSVDGGEPDGSGEQDVRLAEVQESRHGEEAATSDNRTRETVARVRDVVTGAAGTAMELGRKMVEAGKARREPGESERKRVEPAAEKAPAGDGGSGAVADGEGGSFPGEEVLEGRRQVAFERETEVREARRLSDETVAGLAESIESARGTLDRIEAWSAKMSPQLEAIAGSEAVASMDGRRGRRRKYASVAVIVLAVLAGVALGGGLQSRIEVLPQADPSLGWKDHVWDHYGEAFMQCFDQARKAETGRANCELDVRGR